MEIRNKIQTQCFPLRIDVHHRAANCLRDSREPGKEPDFAMQVTQPRATAPLSVPFSPEIITIPLSLSSQDQKAQTVNSIINHLFTEPWAASQANYEALGYLLFLPDSQQKTQSIRTARAGRLQTKVGQLTLPDSPQRQHPTITPSGSSAKGNGHPRRCQLEVRRPGDCWLPTGFISPSLWPTPIVSNLLPPSCKVSV